MSSTTSSDEVNSSALGVDDGIIAELVAVLAEEEEEGEGDDDEEEEEDEDAADDEVFGIFEDLGFPADAAAALFIFKTPHREA
jgi:hypothetical protein